MKKRKIEWNKVTWYSKLAAVIIFGLTFLIAFNLGRDWERAYPSSWGMHRVVEQTGSYRGR